MNPKLIVEQKITAFANKYAIYQADAAANRGPIVAFAQQKRLAFKEKVSFYTDETKTSLAFTMRVEKVFDIHGKYLIEDPGGVLIGAFQKSFKSSLVNSTWNILGASGQPVLTVSESSQFLALLRRFGGLLPFVGDIVDILVQFFKYHFKFVASGTEPVIGKFEKTTLFRDHYRLSLTDEAFAQADWRTFAAFAVALDALQSR